MSLRLRDKLLANRPGEGAGRQPRLCWLWSCAIAFVCIVVVAVLFHGCEQREIVRTTPQMDVESPFWVRVLLTANTTECTVTAPSAVHVSQSGLGPAASAAGPRVPSLRQPTKVTLSDGQLLLGDIVLRGTDVTISPERPHIFGLDGRNYRGRLQITICPGERTFDIVNLVPLEAYLAGVVGAEMPDYWEPEALKAQAIAARTYCLYIKNRFGVNRRWDVSRTQASQVYDGIRAESAQVWDAVNDTYGSVLVTGERNTESRLPLNLLSKGLFPAYYSALCGGHTADSEKVFGDAFRSLKGVPCPHCKDVAKLGLFFWPMTQFDRPTVTRQLVERYPTLKSLGEITDIVAVEKTDHGSFSRLTRIRLVGSTGRTDTLRAEDLRLAIDPTGRKIKSTICNIVPWGNGWAFLSGRGWGHGVGMCQCGAEGLARVGNDAKQILRYYYPGSEIMHVY